MNVLKMGWRNVWRNKRRSLVTIAAMTLALWVLLLYSGLIPGYLRSMENSVTQLELGDVQIHAEGFLDSPSLYTLIEDSDEVVARLEEQGIAASPRLLGGGLAAAGESSAGVALRALDVERDAKVSKLAEVVASGEWLDAADPKGVVIGKLLAKNLGAKPGAELLIVSQAADGSMANDLYTVRGVLGAVSQGTDRATVLMNIDAFRALMVVDQGVHQIVLNRGEMELEALSDAAKAAAGGHDVKSWKELMPAVAQMMASVGGMIYIFALIIYVAVAILILNAMLTAVFERIREFGVFKAIGAGPGRVLGLIVVEGAVQAFVAMVVGILLALLPMWYLGTEGAYFGALGGMDAAGVAMPEKWIGIYSVQSCMGPVIMLWFISMAAVAYPAVKAAFINPITAMRYGAGAQRDGLLARAYDWLAEKVPAVDRLVNLVLNLTTRPLNRMIEALLPWLGTIAWRNLWRQKRRTLLTLVSIAFGLYMAVLMMAMQDRSFGDFIDTASRLGAGHVVFQHPDYLETPSLGRTVQDTEALRALAAKDPRVEHTTERIMGEAMVATAHDSFGAAFIAYDPAFEDEASFGFLEGIVEGEWYETADDKGIILGKTLARNLGAELGDKVVYTMMDKNGEIVAGMGRLSGTLGTGAPSGDAALFLLPLNRARETLGYSADEATHVGIFLDDNRDSVAVAQALRPQVGEGVASLAWSEIAPDLKAFVAMKKGGGRFFLIIIGLLVTAGIFNTLFMSIMERVREFGIMIAIGYSPGQIFRMVMWESVYLAVVGLLLGASMTAGPYFYLAKNGIDMSEMYAGQDVSVGGVGFDMHMNIGIYPESAVIIVCCIIFATLAAGLYPAWKAGRVEPVDSIKLV
jgi:putative ABC transport system permease protein